jgi:DNA-binding NtrC family response regulator
MVRGATNSLSEWRYPIMTAKNLLDGKRILAVDDEPDVLETLQDLLHMCDVTKAASFEEAKELLETQNFELVILDIMGVAGYDLLEISNRRNLTAVMLTAHALTPENIVKSYKQGAAYFLPKEEMVNIAGFLNDILEAKTKGKSTWDNWLDKLADYCERTFGSKWQDTDKDFWDRFPFY